MKLKYFAYGSNMCTNRLRARVSSAEKYAVATLTNHDLKFHKTSTDRAGNVSGKCNALHTGNLDDEVIGVVFEIEDSQKPDLDKFEGVGHGYHETTIKIDSSGKEITAYMYVADYDATDDKLSPYTWYKDFVVQGAKQHHLPESYIQDLEAVKAIPDPDGAREQRNRRVLPC